MKIALITAGNLWVLPFVRIYSDFLDKMDIEYDIISWNRDGNDKKEGIQYLHKQDLTANSFSKLIALLKYAHFVKNVIKKNNYDKLIVFNPQIALFIFSVLRKYKNRFIFDYRDLSIEQTPFFASRFKKILEYSDLNVISSPGFIKALPQGFDYIICHNFNINQVKQAIAKPIIKKDSSDKKTIILTIGGIRDFSSNAKVIDALANKENYILRFVGKGIAAEPLEKYCKDMGVLNAEFYGYYPKNKEQEYIEESTYLNIFYPRLLSHDTALSNRFYNSLIFKRPMIVTKNTTQGDFAQTYGVGVVVENCDELSLELQKFSEISYNEYANKCNSLLKIFLAEQENFYDLVKKFVSEI